MYDGLLERPPGRGPGRLRVGRFASTALIMPRLLLLLAGFLRLALVPLVGAETPPPSLAGTALERDHEFDGDSRIRISKLTPTQVANLATLGRVWGFLKYHHPKITSGGLHWDYELFRVLPKVLAAADAQEASVALGDWLAQLGDVASAAPAAPEPPLGDVHFAADFAWLDDAATLGADLRRRLQAIRAAHRSGTQFYVSLARGIGNPQFERERAYPDIASPDAGYQLLALFRFWNIIQYWSPYRNLIEESWHDVLREFIPRAAQAGTRDDYQLVLIALIARVHDTHANLWGSLHVRPPTGSAQLPAVFRFIDEQAVVAQVATVEPRPMLQRGDIVLSLDGKPVRELRAAWAPFYAASNEPTRLRDIGRAMGRGELGTVALRVQRGDDELDLEVARVPSAEVQRAIALTHELPGPAFRRLSDQVAYLALSRARASDAGDYVQQAAGTKGWVLDLRSYPADFPILFQLGGRLVAEPTDFVRFTFADLAHPGTFFFGAGKPVLQPLAPRYAGKIVILVDETTQSRAEYFAMAFRAAPGAIVVGSTTAAADGNVSDIPLPGKLRTMISGIGVFYPDKRPTQRVGIVPDIVARPTVAGLRAGRDEVLEAAIRAIVGPDFAADEIRKMIPAGQ
jgi:hypothetical protein